MLAPTPAPVSFDPAALDQLAQTLAAYLGPIAKILVANTARRTATMEQLRDALANEIPAAASRQRFLAAVRNLAS